MLVGKILLLILSFLVVSFSIGQDTLLDSIYQKEKDNNNIISTGVNVDSNSIITSPIKNTIILISQIAVALGVTLIIIGGIRFILSSSDENKFASVRKNIIWIILGLVLVLSATSIIIFYESLVNYFLQNV